MHYAVNPAGFQKVAQGLDDLIGTEPDAETETGGASGGIVFKLSEQSNQWILAWAASRPHTIVGR